MKASHFRLFLPVLVVFLVGRIHLVVHTKHPYITEQAKKLISNIYICIIVIIDNVFGRPKGGHYRGIFKQQDWLLDMEGQI